MTLNFDTKINYQPTQFVDKILAGLFKNKLITDVEFNSYRSQYLEKNYPFIFNLEPKTHTIIKDESDKWGNGAEIHFTIKDGTKNRFQFAPVTPCISTQTIEIKNIFNDRHAVFVNRLRLLDREIDKLAKNEGFNSTDDFWNYYYYQDFQGKIIHWTNFKY